MEFFATCPKGFEQLLGSELTSLGISRVRPLQGQVAFTGSLADAYMACLWSRLASRVVAVVARVDARDSEALYAGVYEIGWEEHLLPTRTFAVHASGTNTALKSTQFTALRVKDAIVDRLLSQRGTRESVDTNHPDLSVVARLSKNRLTLGIDLTGSPLFERSYSRGRADKGLRPDYAAALLMLGSWHTHCDEDAALYAFAQYPDSILIEAASMAAHSAPGLRRGRWGFDGWALHEADLWQPLVDDARQQARGTISTNLAARSLSGRPLQAKSVLRSLGITADITSARGTGDHAIAPSSLLAADLSDVRPHEIVHEASMLGQLAKYAQETRPLRITCASRDNLPAAYLQCQSGVRISSMLGREELWLQLFDEPAHSNALAAIKMPSGITIPVLVPASDQFAARLKKVARARAKWARREDISCYRLYDSDLPDYAVTIDLFQGTNPHTGELDGNKWLQIYEYAPPKGVDATLARSRLMDVLSLAPAILGVKGEDTFLRVRRKDKGGSQYASEARRTPAFSRMRQRGHIPLPVGAHLIDEGGLTFEVNFDSRLDCGIFLDHRDTRGMLRELAKQTKGSKRFLNLFAYTGTATCYAADGGMRHTTTVDLSRPSLDWARRNMARNGFDGPEHEFVQADVISWIREQRHSKNRWDLVFCDVPTFSNSNRMGKKSFDVQRDHVELLIGVSRLLMRDGVCVFSCNLRTFRPDVEALRKARVSIEDITNETIPEDFTRNKRVHHAYVVKRMP